MHPFDDTAGSPWDLDPGDLLRVTQPSEPGDDRIPLRFCTDTETAVATLRVDRHARVVHLPRGFDDTPAWGLVGREDDDVFVAEGDLPPEVVRWCHAHPARISTARGFVARGVLVHAGEDGTCTRSTLTARGWVPAEGSRGCIVVAIGSDAPGAVRIEVSLDPASLAGVLQRWGALALDLACTPELRIEEVDIALGPPAESPGG